MYLDSDTKVIISGAVILLVGIIVWKKHSGKNTNNRKYKIKRIFRLSPG